MNNSISRRRKFKFTYALLKKVQYIPSIIASTYEDYSELCNFGKRNVNILKTIGIKTLFNTDATKLHNIWQADIFNTIIFQFPNVGSREPIDGHNPNYILVRDFIGSALKVLKSNWSIIITSVDSNYNNNMFKFEKIAKLYSIKEPIKYVFDPTDYSEYQHMKTHEEESAIEDYKDFATWEFKL